MARPNTPQPDANPAATSNGTATPNGTAASLWFDPPWPAPAMATRFGTALLQFASRRMQADADHLARLAECRTVQDIMDEQGAYLRHASQAYAIGLGALLGAGTTDDTAARPGTIA